MCDGGGLSSPISRSPPTLPFPFKPSRLCHPPRPPFPSPHSSCTPCLYISRRGAVSLVAAVVALEYSCLASQHNLEIREPSAAPLNGKISPHRLLHRMHSLPLSFNPLPPRLLPSFLLLLSTLHSSAVRSSSSSPVLSGSLKPLLTFILPSLPSRRLPLYCSLPLVCLF